MRSRTALSAIVVLLLAGCGDDDGETVTTTVRETVTETAGGSETVDTPVDVTLFFLRDGKVEALGTKVIPEGARVAAATIESLLKGPPVSGEDVPETAIPEETELGGVTIEGGVARVELSRTLDREAQAQVVYTLTQFPTVERVQLLAEGEPQGGPRGRAAYEEQTPAILVLSPLPGEEVESGFEVTGPANTFEANFQYELLDRDGNVVTKDFVTATSGSGTRGTFEFTVRYTVPETQYGTLVVYETSAEDGSRTNERRVSLALR
jgi:germination protein M